MLAEHLGLELLFRDFRKSDEVEMEDDEDMSPAGSTTADTAFWPLEIAATSDSHAATPAPSDATELPIAETSAPSRPLAAVVGNSQKNPQNRKVIQMIQML